MSNRGNQKMPVPPKKVQEDKDEAALLAQAEQEELEAQASEAADESEEAELNPEEEKALEAEKQAKQDLLPKHSQVINGPAVLPVAGDNSKKSVVPRKGPIRVVALRDGFIYNSRKKEGDIFTIENEKQLGKWMKII